MGLPPDMMAQLGGGGLPPGGGGGLPPDLAAMLGGGGAPGGPEEAPQGESDPHAAYQAAIDGTDDPETLITWSVEMARKAASLDPDHIDTLKIEKATTALQQYLSDLQAKNDQAMQGKAGPGAVRKMAGAISGP